jgi:cell wall-associated NlpC family hydrolase
MTLSEVRFGSGVSDARVSLVSFATQFVGNPYVWGGTSLTNGADCSGFVLSVYAQYGISLPHSSSAQSHYGTRVSTSELQPGDLLFYGSGSISHVAIYIGNGQIVHASTERTGIIISNAFYRSPICCVSLLD